MAISDWKAYYLKPRTEKKAASVLGSLGIEYYLPLRSRTRAYQRRLVTFETPLFPGYIFAAVPVEKRAEFYRHGHVVHSLPVSRPYQMLRQLVMVRKALTADPELETADPVTAGEIVKIATGAMQGFTGVVVGVKRKRGKVKVSMTIDIVGQAVVLQTDVKLIERLYDPKTKKHPRADK